MGALKEPKSSRCSAALSCLPPGSSVPPLPLLPARPLPAGVLLHGRCLQAGVCLQKTRSDASDGEALKVTPGLCCSALLATVIYGYARAEGPTPCQFLNVHLQTVLSVLARSKGDAAVPSCLVTSLIRFGASLADSLHPPGTTASIGCLLPRVCPGEERCKVSLVPRASVGCSLGGLTSCRRVVLLHCSLQPRQVLGQLQGQL